MEPGPVGSGPVLRKHQMGQKSPRTRGGENGAGQSWCCIPNENRIGHESRRLAFAGARLFPEKIACAIPAIVTGSEADEPLKAFTNLRACSYYGCSVCRVFMDTSRKHLATTTRIHSQ